MESLPIFTSANQSNMKKNNVLNTYLIKWAILVPVTGKATKKDENIVYKLAFGHRNISSNEIYFHAASQDKMAEKISCLKGKLSKEYRVTIITDKQLGMAKVVEGFISVATHKQMQDSFLLK